MSEIVDECPANISAVLQYAFLTAIFYVLKDLSSLLQYSSWHGMAGLAVPANVLNQLYEEHGLDAAQVGRQVTYSVE
jgi:hypothetical protein